MAKTTVQKEKSLREKIGTGFAVRRRNLCHTNFPSCHLRFEVLIPNEIEWINFEYKP